MIIFQGLFILLANGGSKWNPRSTVLCFLNNNKTKKSRPEMQISLGHGMEFGEASGPLTTLPTAVSCVQEAVGSLSQ